MKILIVGGGVAGSGLVGCLKKRGVKAEITLIEKAPAFHHIGFLIGLWGNGRDVLKYLEIDQIAERNGYKVTKEKLKNASGRSLRDLMFEFSEKSPITISRADLHEGLITLLSGVDVRFNTFIESVVQKDKKVEVTFNNQSKETYDLVVGADGIHSSVRNQVFGEGFMKLYGWDAWAYWLPKSFSYPKDPTGFLGSGRTVFILPSHSSSTATLIAKVPSPITNPDKPAVLKELFSGFGGAVPELLLSAPESQEIWHDSVAHVRMPVWYKDRVVLIGDAQHAVSPLVGMGSSMALEDAYVLAEEIAGNQELDTALLRFAERRDLRMKRFLRIVDRVDGWLNNSGVLSMLRNAMTSITPSSYFTGIIRNLLYSKM